MGLIAFKIIGGIFMIDNEDLIKDFEIFNRYIKNKDKILKIKAIIDELLDDFTREYYQFTPVVVMPIKDLVNDYISDIEDLLDENNEKTLNTDLGIIGGLLDDLNDELDIFRVNLEELEIVKELKNECKYLFVKEICDPLLRSALNTTNYLHFLTFLKANYILRNMKIDLVYNCLENIILFVQDGQIIAKTNQIEWSDKVDLLIDASREYINSHYKFDK